MAKDQGSDKSNMWEEYQRIDHKKEWLCAQKQDYKYRTIEDMPGNIILLDANRQAHVVSREEVSTTSESVGVWIALDGNQ